ncbi:Cupin-like domain protein [Pseudomonas amygdali pv. morsprunorum]|nr:Cupin-like domain protein [Pseudomonas amygdali pv. morsprunorum]
MRCVGKSAQPLFRSPRLAIRAYAVCRAQERFMQSNNRFRLMRSTACQLAGLAAITAAVMLPVSSAYATKKPPIVVTEGIKAYRLCTGPDNLSHVIEGSIDQKAMTDVNALHFKETPAHSQYDWHAAPEEQYVITLSGTLEFSTTGGENFVLRPGEILLAQDTTGPGHRWKLIDDQPWRRAYVITKPGDKAAFVPKDGAASKGC